MPEKTATPPVKNIYEAINAVMAHVGYVQKQSSPNLKYTFAGESALIQALRPEMVEHGIVMSVADYQVESRTEYQTERGTRMINTTIVATIVFAHAPSATSLEVRALGEGSDSGDKSINKAMTGAYKYALRQTFLIETGDDPDKDDGNQTGQANGTVKAAAKPATAATAGGNGNGNGKEKATRPIPATKLVEMLVGRAETLTKVNFKEDPRRAQMVAAGIRNALAINEVPKDQIDAAYRGILNVMAGVTSAKDLKPAMAEAILAWLQLDDKWEPCTPCVLEIADFYDTYRAQIQPGPATSEEGGV